MRGADHAVASSASRSADLAKQLYVRLMLSTDLHNQEQGPILRNRPGGRMDRRAATCRLHHLVDEAGIKLPRIHPHMLLHTFFNTMLDVRVDLRDCQIAARHADPRITMRYDRPLKNFDSHPNCILAGYLACAT